MEHFCFLVHTPKFAILNLKCSVRTSKAEFEDLTKTGFS